VHVCRGNRHTGVLFISVMLLLSNIGTAVMGYVFYTLLVKHVVTE